MSPFTRFTTLALSWVEAWVVGPALTVWNFRHDVWSYFSERGDPYYIASGLAVLVIYVTHLFVYRWLEAKNGAGNRHTKENAQGWQHIRQQLREEFQQFRHKYLCEIHLIFFNPRSWLMGRLVNLLDGILTIYFTWVLVGTLIYVRVLLCFLYEVPYLDKWMGWIANVVGMDMDHWMYGCENGAMDALPDAAAQMLMRLFMLGDKPVILHALKFVLHIVFSFTFGFLLTQTGHALEVILKEVHFEIAIRLYGFVNGIACPGDGTVEVTYKAKGELQIKYDERGRVVEVIENGPADDLGIVKDDQILKVNGKDFSKAVLEKAEKLTCEKQAEKQTKYPWHRCLRRQAKFTFDPKSVKLLGIECDADGRVTKILDGSQAKAMDIKTWYRIVKVEIVRAQSDLSESEENKMKVETLEYSQENLARARDGNAEYKLTFEVESPARYHLTVKTKVIWNEDLYCHGCGKVDEETEAWKHMAAWLKNRQKYNKKGIAKCEMCAMDVSSDHASDKCHKCKQKRPLPIQEQFWILTARHAKHHPNGFGCADNATAEASPKRRKLDLNASVPMYGSLNAVQAAASKELARSKEL